MGETLTVLTNGIADEDGLTNVLYSYQWITSDGNADTAIAGETDSTYTLVRADEGKTIKVGVNFTDDADNAETLTSAATGVVEAKPNSPATGAPTIGGTAQVGETLTVLTNGIADEDGLTNVLYSYQWITSDGNADTAIAGETDSTYTLVRADEGKTIKVGVNFTDDADNAETLISAATGVASRSDKPVADGSTPVWSADMSVVDLGNGSIGAVSANLFSNQEGSAGLQAKWLWYYSPGRYIRLSFTDVVPSGEELTLEIGDVALTLQAGDSAFTWEEVDVDWEDGQVIPVRIVPTSETAVSQPNTPATGGPTISGTAQVDQTLTADTSNIADQDGLNNVSYSYRWIAGGTDIDGATGSTYTLNASEQGQTIRVRVTFTDDRDNAETLTSVATVAVVAAPNREATGQPAIGGTPQVDQTLTADTSNIADQDGLNNVSYSYQWMAGGSDIDGATGSTYTLTASEQGQTVQVKVTFTDDRNNAETLTSVATVAVAVAPNREATGQPTIDGTPQVGETLTADTANIADQDGLNNVYYSYQWIAGGTDIVGATGSSYELTSSERGQPIQVRVTFTDDGDNEETLTSAATEVVQQGGNAWSATITVGTRDGYTGYSYWGDPGLGSLSATEVEWDGKTHYVRFLFLKDGELRLGLNEEMFSTGFVLSVGDEEFGSADAMVDHGGASYRFRWDDRGLGWSDGEEVS